MHNLLFLPSLQPEVYDLDQYVWFFVRFIQLKMKKNLKLCGVFIRNCNMKIIYT